ncbi:MarR family winged helix-turn-helix transcriptional regulator [Chengkuizengella axinellae]|uniref:SMC-Scp complex subunit ScpB n=1 Tax=Chengkuizengella axinellae TaxID=3064388 RepID=A0ABT9J3A4_9BACL|nr:SMC-Scp complex subunit ScpB [Chengkuizengella sp. 2205SS18-9]MDP5275953.1 SMC-Scp complex subunit ScpB [Chengkuizengella sp. 2205SS18-9]
MDNHKLFNKLITFTNAVYRVTEELTKEAKPNVLTQIQFDILDFIARNQPVTLSEICDCTHLSMPNASRELRKLGENDLIEKKSDVDDRRKQYIYMTSSGEKMIEDAYKLIKVNFDNRIKDISKEDLDEINYAIDKLQSKFYFDR